MASVSVPKSEWEWTEMTPCTANAMVLMLRLPPGVYDRETIATALKVPEHIVMSDDVELLREYGGKW